MTEKKQPRRFDAPAAAVLVAALAALAAIYIWAPAEDRAAELAGVGVFFLAVLSFMRSVYGTGAMLLAAAIAAASTGLVGCANPVRDQAQAATVSAASLTAGGDVIMAARSAALDRVEAQYPTDPEHDAQLDLEAERWRPLLAALDGAREAILTWISALELAHAADAGAELMAHVLTLGLRAVRLVAAAFEIATSLGVEDLPTLPTLGGS
jgi:hypothetical protein